VQCAYASVWQGSTCVLRAHIGFDVIGTVLSWGNWLGTMCVSKNEFSERVCVLKGVHITNQDEYEYFLAFTFTTTYLIFCYNAMGEESTKVPHITCTYINDTTGDITSMAAIL
jgi:hypothetical protein